MKNPFKNVSSIPNEVMYEASEELPPLNDKGRSIVTRLTLYKDTNSAMIATMYEVDGSSVSYIEAPISVEMFREMSGSGTQYQCCCGHNFPLDSTEDDNCSECGRGYPITCGCGELYPQRPHRGCGARVCNECGDHYGLSNCYCGWSRSGGDGRRNLIEDGECLEDDY